MTTDITELAPAMKAAAEKATPGEWWADEVKNEGCYGSGDDCVEGFTSYAIYGSDGQTLFDSLNSDAACICEEYDGEGHVAWDETAQRNAEFIALANPANILALVEALEKAQRANGYLRHAFAELQERLKADSEPVAYIDKQWTLVYYIPPMSMGLKIGDKLYRHAQQPVVPEEAYSDDFPELYPSQPDAWAAGWNACRAAMLQAGNCRENRNSSTNNCREIAETSTGTAITPAAPDKKLTDDVLDEIIAGAKTSMEQYLALSLKAEREVWRKEGPTDDERIMAIEGIHSCERCGDEGWVVGEMGITRCACGQAGNSPGINGAEQRIADAVELLKQAAPAMLADNNGPNGPLAGRLKSPVIPEGYVMVPKEPTDEMLAASYMFAHVDATRESWLAMLAAAPQEVKGE